VEAPDLDRAVRWAVFSSLRDRSVAPSIEVIGSALGVGTDEVAASMGRLHDSHVLVLYEGTTDVRMALPFAAKPTPFSVRVGDRRWWANCAWDAYAIPAAVGADEAAIETDCPDCGVPMHLEIRGGEAVPANALVHFLLPASRWWDDIVFT
jgi:alkylmercury lyase-like protein